VYPTGCRDASPKKVKAQNIFGQKEGTQGKKKARKGSESKQKNAWKNVEMQNVLFSGGV